MNSEVFAMSEKIFGTYLTRDQLVHLLCGHSVDDPSYAINMLTLIF